MRGGYPPTAVLPIQTPSALAARLRKTVAASRYDAVFDSHVAASQELSAATRQVRRQQQTSEAERRVRLHLGDTTEDDALVDNDADEEDPDSDEEAERILARHAAAREEAAVAQAAVAEALASVPPTPMQPHWGPAVRAAAIAKSLARANQAKLQALSGLREALSPLQSTAQEVLSNGDLLWLIHSWRASAILGSLTTEGGMHTLASCAAVSRAWHDALRQITAERCVLRHCHARKVGVRLRRPSFLEMSPSGEMIISDHHKLTVLPASTASEDAFGGCHRHIGTDTRDDEALEVRGEARGEAARYLPTTERLYHPHGLAVSGDGLSIYVADRSNHRVLRFRASTGQPTDSSRPGLMSAPYGLALLGSALYVADSNHERILVLDAADLGTELRSSFGQKGKGEGQLEQPRGVAVDLYRQEVLVAELGNNRCSIFTTTGDFLRTFGNVPTTDGSLPLRQPYGVMAAHGVLLVSEYDGRRIAVFSSDIDNTPLQLLSPYGAKRNHGKPEPQPRGRVLCPWVT